MRRIPVLITMVVLMVAMLAILGSPAQAATKKVLYGPFTIPAASSSDMPSMLERVRLGVTKPCQNCYITSFQPNLVYPDGSTANVTNPDGSPTQRGVMLHHAVFTNQFRSDATCGSSETLWGLAGERFFASGNERTTIRFPAGYGYRVRWWDSWNLLVDLMNHETQSQSVYLEVTYTYTSASDPVEPLKPVWLDIDNCGDSEYSILGGIPALFSDTHWDWNVNVPGDVMAAAGHVHGHGVAVEATNESQGATSICRSVATLDPINAHLIRSMSTCTADTGPLAHVNLGDTVRLHSEYLSTHPADDVMGIMIAYIHRTT
jgi:hypothetical protein